MSHKKVRNFVPRNKSRNLSLMDLGAVSNTPCTVAEAAQISLAAAKDTVEAYTGDVNKVVIQQTLMISTMKSLLISKGVFTEEEFNSEYTEQAKSYNDEKRKYLESLIKRGESTNEEAEDTRSE